MEQEIRNELEAVARKELGAYFGYVSVDGNVFNNNGNCVGYIAVHNGVAQYVDTSGDSDRMVYSRRIAAG